MCWLPYHFLLHLLTLLLFHFVSLSSHFVFSLTLFFQFAIYFICYLLYLLCYFVFTITLFLALLPFTLLLCLLFSDSVFLPFFWIMYKKCFVDFLMTAEIYSPCFAYWNSLRHLLKAFVRVWLLNLMLSVFFHLTGCKDKSGKPIIIVYCQSEIWAKANKTQLLAKQLEYLFYITRYFLYSISFFAGAYNWLLNIESVPFCQG